jgi:uncharacterized protein YbjQ (UPF0145 family)
VGLLINLIAVLVLLVVGYVTGMFLERRHFASIRAREQGLVAYPALTFDTASAREAVDAVDGGAELVMGSTVVSLDYFKRFVAGLRGIFGGRIASYESLLDRGRREALLRMREDALARGFGAVINIRLETSTLARAAGNGKGVAGIEVLAFGTAVKRS